ncbi:hypothetical protein FBU30_008555 [Linnemannia zychae]|nr:hypothetical protein FBU30_008555 [Linnemannia zychae]
MHTGYFNAWPPRVPTSPPGSNTNVYLDPLGDMHQSRSTPSSTASTPASQYPPSIHTSLSAHEASSTQRSQQHHVQYPHQPLSAPSSPRLEGRLSPALSRLPASASTGFSSNIKNPTTITTNTPTSPNTTTASITPARTPTISYNSLTPSSISTSPTATATTSTLAVLSTTSKMNSPASPSSSPFVRKPRPLSTSFLNTDAFSFRKSSSTPTSSHLSISSGFPLGSLPSSTPPVAYPPQPVVSPSASPPVAPPRGDAAAAYLSDSGLKQVSTVDTHYFDPQPKYGQMIVHSTGSANTSKNSDSKKKQEKTKSIYHQMKMSSLAQTPLNHRLGYSATAPPQTSQLGADQGATGSLPPASSQPLSSSTFPSFQLRTSQDTRKSGQTNKGIKNRFKRLRPKQRSSSYSPMHAVTSGESDSEACNDNDQETVMYNTRGMTGRFVAGLSDHSNSNTTTFTKSKSRQVAAGFFDGGLPQNPLRNIILNHSGTTGGSGGSFSKGSITGKGSENGGPGEGSHQFKDKKASAAPFKDLFKNMNVGSGISSGHHHSHSQSASAAGSPVIHPTSSPSPSWDHPSGSGTGGAGGASMIGLMKPFQARSNIPIFLSGDDQPSNTPRFRMLGSKRRKKKFSKKFNSIGYVPTETDDEDSSAAHGRSGTIFLRNSRQRHHTHHDDVGPRRQHHQYHHQFLKNLSNRHRSRSFDEGSRRNVEIDLRLPITHIDMEKSQMNISPALREARKANKDTGVLLVELEPLPTKIVHDLAAIKSYHQHRDPSQLHHINQTSCWNGSPLHAYLTPSSTAASGFGTSIASGSTTNNTNNHSPQMMTPLLQLQLQEQRQYQDRLQQQQSLLRSKADPAALFCSKSFLFKSYQNSRFRGHYVFRVVGDQIEYKRLPITLEEPCSQYFRRADVTYRSLERKTKAIREEQDKRKRNASRSQSQPQLHYNQQQSQQSQQLHQQYGSPISANLSRTKSQELDGFYGKADSDIPVTTLSSFLKAGGGQSQGDSGRFLRGRRVTSDKWQSSGDDILKSSVAWDIYSPSYSAIESYIPAEVLSDSSISTSTRFSGRSPRSPRGGNSSYLNQRYNPENSSNSLVRTFLSGPGATPGLDLVHKSDPLVQMNPFAAATGIVSFQSPVGASAMARPLLSRKKRSWPNVNEEQRLQMEEEEEEEEEAQFKETIRKYREEMEQSIYGLEQYLSEILKGLEYERFDATTDVRIINDNRDTAIFSLYNGDRTNVMSLESPSIKLKYEFLNRIALSLMGHEETESSALVETKPKVMRNHFNCFLNMSTGTLRDHSEDGTEDSDLLFEMIDIRLRQQEGKLRSMREEIQKTMAEVDSCLSQLNYLDDRAKKMMTMLITAIDSHEIQMALRPSPTTGQTLAETVEAKLRDVNERIVICTRIMGAARRNLNRLKYEIELEQRSIRLFRQYKIIIAVISGSIVFLLWFLYHARASALAPQPASPLYSTPANPFEEIYNFHHGEPPIHPSPESTLEFTSSKIMVPPSTPTYFSFSTKKVANVHDELKTSIDAGLGFDSCDQCKDERVEHNDVNNYELINSQVDLDPQDDLVTVVPNIPDHNEL